MQSKKYTMQQTSIQMFPKENLTAVSFLCIDVIYVGALYT
jgi:hypothetical protein